MFTHDHVISLNSFHGSLAQTARTLGSGTVNLAREALDGLALPPSLVLLTHVSLSLLVVFPLQQLLIHSLSSPLLGLKAGSDQGCFHMGSLRELF